MKYILAAVGVIPLILITIVGVPFVALFQNKPDKANK